LGRRPKWVAPNLSARLVILTLAVLLPALAMAALLVWDAYRHERAYLERQMMETARALSLVIDRQIGQQEVMLQALSSSPYFIRGDWAAFYDQAKRATISPDDWVVVQDARGQQLLNTRTPFGSPLPVTPLDDGPFSWASPPTSQFRTSNMFVGRVNRRAMVVVNMRVARPDGSVMDLTVGTPVESFGRIWRDQQLPPTWVGVVLDEDGRVVARSRDLQRYLGTKTSDAFALQTRQSRQGVVENRTLDGVDSISAWSRAADYGWVFLVAVPKAEIVAAAQRSLAWGAGLGLAILALGVTLAATVAASIAGPVRKLADAARAWGRGEPMALPPTGMAETEQLAAAFADAARSADANKAELKALNATLEHRVAERTRELEDATANLVQAQKLEAIGRLTGGVAHDFNNLLMAISGNLELLGRRISDPKLARYVGQAMQATERGAKLTAQLLAFSRRQRLEPKPIDVNGAVSAAAELLSSTIGADVEVVTELSGDVWPALADATQLELVIVNLSINARHAMPGGGTVTIRTANIERLRPPAQPEGPPPGRFVAITVTDTGQGMTPEVLEHAFEPFFTTKPVGEGAGLGLSQVLGLAKQLGGGVELATRPGEGCSVAVFLPRAEAPAPRAAEAAGADAVRSFEGLAVLLVDDDGDVRAVTCAMLADMGCAVAEAATGLEAIGLAKTIAQADLALLDFAMPGMNGGETALRLREIRPDLPIVVMSGFADAEALAAVWSGPLLQKPFTSAQLGEEVAKVASAVEGVSARA
jgi:signal transduction histidine kinase/CheY-like chemotaxis protein